MDDELSRFKKDINLVEYVASKGFELDNRKSSRTTKILRRNDEKIGVYVGAGGDQMFYDFREEKSGTVIDFAQSEIMGNLGHVRKELRSYLGAPRPEIRFTKPKPKKSKQEQSRALKQEQQNIRPVDDIKYLLSRDIPEDIISNPRFAGLIYNDDYNNICFPHYNGLGFSGCEKKNADFTGFSKGGQKGLWFSNAVEGFEKIVFCESGIDCLSYAALNSSNKAVYVSIGGQMSYEQESQIKALIKRNKDKIMVAAFDNDSAGRQYTDDLQKICVSLGVKFDINLPSDGKDWNDALHNLIASTDDDILNNYSM